MPSSMTHTYFGLDVYDGLSKRCSKAIDSKLEHFKLFCQGPDPFMFYHFFVGKKTKEMKGIQKMMHCEKTQQFFLNTIRYIHEHKLQANQEAMAYLYGYICHYYLDLYTHPFIYYKSGVFEPKDKNTYKYNGFHQQIEYAIDLYFISKREIETPVKFKVYKKIFGTTPFSSELEDLISCVIGKTYSIKNSVSKYQKSIKYMKRFFYLANYDPCGIKLKAYQLIDKITPEKVIKIKELSYYNNYVDIANYLNVGHKKWAYPWEEKQLFTDSFLDLYRKAKREAISTIQEITKLLENDILDIKKVKQIFPNLSYATGKPCHLKLEMKYFEF